MKPFLVRALDDETCTVRMVAAFSLLSLGIRSLEGDSERSFTTAKEIYVTCAGTSPDHAPTQLDLGKFHILEGDLASATEAFEASCTSIPIRETLPATEPLPGWERDRDKKAKDLLQKVGSDSAFHADARALLESLSDPEC